MYSAILKSLNIEKREAGMVLLLVLQSFFIGIFFATLENSATTLFMMKYGEEKLGFGFLVSGVLGIILTGGFSFLQNRIRFSVLITFNMIMIFLLTFAMWYSFNYTTWEYLEFSIFSLMGALYILSLVAFSGMASRLFTLRQGKRLFSIIDSGLVFGMIVICFAIPVIVRLIPHIKDLILISAVSIFFALIFQSIIASKFKFSEDTDDLNEGGEEEVSEGVGVVKFISDKYIRLLALFVIVSMIALFFTSYNFLTVGRINYPEQIAFSSFIANFTIAVMSFSFILKTFVYSKLLKTYGLKVSLLVAPILIGFFALVAAVIGSFGFEVGSASFIIFFLLLALVRFFGINLKDSIQAPSLRLLFQPIDARIRYNVQAKVEGLVNELSATLSGLILMGMGALTFIHLINYSHILVLIVGAWIYITLQLYKEYQNMLRNSLVEYKKRKQLIESKNIALRDEAEKKRDNAVLIKKLALHLDMMKEYEPTMFDIKLDQLLRENNIQTKKLAIKSIDESEIFGAIKELKNIEKQDSNPDIKTLANEVRSKLEKSYKSLLDEEKIVYLARSKNFEDRIRAAKIISDSGNHDFSSLLKNLMRDLMPQVKLQAIHGVIRLNNPDLWSTLIDQLSDEKYRAATEAAVVQIGEDILPNLERAYYKSGAESELQVSIVGLYGRIGGDQAVKYLLKKINDPNRQIVFKALYSLRELNYRAENEVILNQIYQAIEQNVSTAAWNFAAKFDVEDLGMGKYLSYAFEHEMEENYNMIFLLLSLAYDPESIQHIRDNIESGTTEGVSFAIEMLDLFIAEQLKTVLFPLLEDNRPEEKIRDLELHFPINVYGNTDVLKQIMNRSANFLNNYTRACAIYTYLDIEKEEQNITIDIIANLFNPDPLLRETSAIVMNAIDPATYNESKARLSENMQDELDMAISMYKSNPNSVLIEKVSYLNHVRLMHGQDQNMVEDLAIDMKYRKIGSGETIIRNNAENNYFFIISGEAVADMKTGALTFTDHEFVNDMIFMDKDEKDASIKAVSDLEVYEIPNSDIKTLLFKYPKIGEIMLQIIDRRISSYEVSA
ncbi:MAG TPA: hypothetical protein DCX54_02740 [Flavobacteriales bacterium]|nr:hypothetical protein [Flavobacteriales bacterium]